MASDPYARTEIRDGMRITWHQPIEMDVASADEIIDTFWPRRASVHVIQDGEEVAAKRSVEIVAHGYFRAEEAMEAATSLAILICASRSRS